MGTKNRQRRAAKKRRRQRPSQRSGAHEQHQGRQGGPHGTAAAPTLEELIWTAAAASRADPAGYEAALGAVVRRGQPALATADRLLRQAVSLSWDHGWTPADIAHVTARDLSAAHAAVLAAVVVADGRDRAQRGEALHPRWQAQLAALAELGQPHNSAHLTTGLRLAAELLWLLAHLPTVPWTMSRPGETPRAAEPAGLDERVLTRVRALLRKAESTSFDEEAEALTAKAQELIARYALNEALLHAPDDVGQPGARRILIDNPYAAAKSFLVAEVAEANRCRAVHSMGLGWCTVFGYDHDLDAVELLVTSLLSQATNAMVRHGSRLDIHGRSRTRSFRRSFLLGFANRIGQRLRGATETQVAAMDASDDRLLPVLAARDEHVRAAAQAAFPEAFNRLGSVSNSAGWAAGQVAADLADLDFSAGALRHHAS